MRIALSRVCMFAFHLGGFDHLNFSLEPEEQVRWEFCTIATRRASDSLFLKLVKFCDAWNFCLSPQFSCFLRWWDFVYTVSGVCFCHSSKSGWFGACQKWMVKKDWPIEHSTKLRRPNDQRTWWMSSIYCRVWFLYSYIPEFFFFGTPASMAGTPFYFLRDPGTPGKEAHWSGKKARYTREESLPRWEEAWHTWEEKPTEVGRKLAFTHTYPS